MYIATSNNKLLTNDALLEVLIVAVVADLLQQQRMEFLERFQVFESRVDHVQIITSPVRRPANTTSSSHVIVTSRRRH